MQLSHAYLRVMRVPPGQLIALSADDTLDVASMRAAVLFVLAEWSGASQLSFRALNEVLAEMPDVTKAISLYIIDTGSAAAREFMKEAGDVPAGSGETYWIRKGTIVGRLASCTEAAKDTIRQLTRTLSEGS